jgi:hypothetical protein
MFSIVGEWDRGISAYRALKAAGVAGSIERSLQGGCLITGNGPDYARYISALTELMEISGVFLKTLREYTIDEKLIDENRIHDF